MIIQETKLVKIWGGFDLAILKVNLNPWFLNPDQTVRSDWKNFEPFTFTVLLASKTVLWQKTRNPCKPRSDLTVLRTVIRPLLTVPTSL